MRAAPPLQISVHRFGLWQGAVWLLAALDLATVSMWCFTHERPFGAGPLLIIGLSALALFALLRSARMPAVQLRWDGQAWHFGPTLDDEVIGDVSVAIDLGGWMLLRLRPASASSSAAEPNRAVPRAKWLPVQRRGLGGSWHAFRCAVYSPRPVVIDDVPAGF